MIKKYAKFIELIKEESGIRDITKIIQDHKDTGSVNFEIWFHQDLDGVSSALCMKKYLEDYGLKLIDAHIIQYGGLEYCVKNKRPGSMAVLVDFAHFRTLFSLATDHHSGQTGVTSGSSHAKPSRSNAETISGEISNSDIFTSTDVKLIQTVDSADFLKYGITPDDVETSIFKINKGISGEKNRILMGFVVNRLLLVYKNKRITVDSLDGRRNHVNKNLLECMVLDCNPSLISMFTNIQNYMKNAVSLEWDSKTRSNQTPKKLTTPEEINRNLEKYIKSRKDDESVEYDNEYKIIRQYGIGSVFAPGSYDRYVPFKNNPEAEFICTIFPMGLIQASCNPFKEKRLKDIDLAQITKEVLSKYKYQLSNINIPIYMIKRISESDVEGMKKKYGSDYTGIGFSFADLVTFYDKDIVFLPNLKQGDSKTRKNLNLTGKEDIEIINSIKKCMSKPFDKWSNDEKKEMENFKVPILRIIEASSGGHPSITNIQGLNYMSSRKDLLLRLFNTENYTDVMILIADEFIKILKEKIDISKSGKEISYKGNDIELTDNLSERFDN